MPFVVARSLRSVLLVLLLGLALSAEGFAESRASANRLVDSRLGGSAAEAAPSDSGSASAARGARDGFDGLTPPPGSYTELLLAVEVEGLPEDAPFELAIRYRAKDLASPALIRSAERVMLRPGSSGEVLLSLGELRDAAPVVAAAPGPQSRAPLFCEPTGVGTRVAMVEFHVVSREPLTEEDLPIQLRLRADAVNARPAVRACVSLAALSSRFHVPTGRQASPHQGVE